MARTKGSVSKIFKELFYIGSKFGKWEVIDNKLIYEGKRKHGKIKVKCECGFIGTIDPYPLKKGQSTCCFDCGHNKKGENSPIYKGFKEIPGSWFLRYKNRSNKYEFNIELKDIYDLWIKQNKKCALTGLEIDFNNYNFKTISKRKGKNFNYDLKCTASLDRIDSKKGYILNNIQLVHKDINMMKKEYNQEYFINMCYLVINNLK